MDAQFLFFQSFCNHSDLKTTGIVGSVPQMRNAEMTYHNQGEAV